MGEAKRKGSFKQRRAKAIAKDIKNLVEHNYYVSTIMDAINSPQWAHRYYDLNRLLPGQIFMEWQGRRILARA